MRNLSAVDTLVMVMYMLLLAAVGVYFARQKRTLKTYLLADQNVHWIIVGISVMAALFSGITYLGAPAETFFFDLRYVWVLISFFIATPITTLVFLPLFRSKDFFTAYEYLERRFDWRLRRIASVLFLLRVTFYLGLAIYAPALAIMDVTGWPLWVSVLATGTIATVYTAFGGMKAVIWTDTIQFIILCGGILVILIVASMRVPGGIATAWKAAAAAGKTQFFNFSLDPTVRITVWSGILGGTCYNLVQMVTDQISVQRYITAPTLKESQRALWLKFWVTLPVVGLFYLTGTVLYGYYHSFPERVPRFVNAVLVPQLAQPASGGALQRGALQRGALQGDALQNDRLLPYFVTRELPTPLPGLLIAAILGATVAVVSAGINALATSALIDFRRPEKSAAQVHSIGSPQSIQGIEPGGDSPGEPGQVRRARLLTVIFGIIPTVLALFVIPYFGSLIEAIGRIAGLFGGPLLGVFFLGALCRRANATGALCGALSGAIVGIGSAFSQQIFHYPLSFLWIAFVAAVSTFITGALTSYLAAPPTDEAAKFLFSRAASRDRIPMF